MNQSVPKNNAKNCRTYHSRLRSAAFKAYAGEKGIVCACCGEKEHWFLTLDHILGDGNIFRKSLTGKNGPNDGAGGWHTYLALKKLGYPKGLQILCGNCQLGKQLNEGVCPHENSR